MNQRGNVLFLILIAVALFAALSYAVTNSSRSGEGNISREKAKLLASEIIQYAAQVEQAISRMMIINKVSVEYIDVNDPGSIVVQGDNTNCTSNECKLFYPEGGNINAKLLPLKATDPAATSWSRIDGQSRPYFMIIPVQDVGSDLADLVLLYGGVDEDVCDELNYKLGVTSRGDSIPVDAHGAGFGQQSGDLTPYPVISTALLGNEDTRIQGKRSFCVNQLNVLFGHYFYHVLVAR